MDDVLLVQECLEGKSRAQKALFEKFAPKMLAVCYRYMKDKEESEDALQISMVKVYQKLADFKQEGALEGWIRRIVVNTCLDQLRRGQKHAFDYSLDEVSYKVEIKEEVLSNIHATELLSLISSMPPGYRVVFNMFAIEGFSHQEIANQLKITESTSKSQYLRARAFLRQRIEDRENGKG